MALFSTSKHHQISQDREALWRDYRTALVPRAGNDTYGTYRPSFGLTE